MRRLLAWLFVVLAALVLSFILFLTTSGILLAVIDEQNWRQVLAVRTRKAITDYGEQCLQCLHRATVTATLDKKIKDDGQISRLQNVAHFEDSTGKVQYKEDPFWEATISHDGRAVHSVSGGVFSSWAADSGELLRKFDVAPYGNSDGDRRLTGKIVVAVVPLPSNARAVVLSDTGTLSIWDVERKQLLDRFPSKLPGKGLEVSAEGTWVGWWGQDEAQAWNLKRRGAVRMPHPGVIGIVFVGEAEAITLSPNELLRWDLDSGQMKRRTPFQAEGKYLGHARSGRWLYFSVQGQLTVQDASTGALVKTLDTRNRAMRMACSGGDERYLAAGSDDGTFLVWDQPSGALLAEQSAFEASLDLLRCAGSSARIMTLGMQRRVGRVWDLERVAGQVKRAQLGVPIEIVFTDQEWWLQDLVDRALDAKWLDRAPWLVDLVLGREMQVTSLSAVGLLILFYFAKGLNKYSKT